MQTLNLQQNRDQSEIPKFPSANIVYDHSVEMSDILLRVIFPWRAKKNVKSCRRQHLGIRLVLHTEL